MRVWLLLHAAYCLILHASLMQQAWLLLLLPLLLCCSSRHLSHEPSI